jgi:hypothetical protein
MFIIDKDNERRAGELETFQDKLQPALHPGTMRFIEIVPLMSSFKTQILINKRSNEIHLEGTHLPIQISQSNIPSTMNQPSDTRV